MLLTDKEEKIARLALDKGTHDGERQAAAIKLVESLYARGVQVEDINIDDDPEIIYREIPVYRDVPVYVRPKTNVTRPKDEYDEPFKPVPLPKNFWWILLAPLLKFTAVVLIIWFSIFHPMFGLLILFGVIPGTLLYRANVI